jgi:hypothetical protein
MGRLYSRTNDGPPELSGGRIVCTCGDGLSAIAPAHGARLQAVAIGAPHMRLPAKVPRHA